MSNDCPEYFGKYRGEVENAVDPLGLGRVQVSVPDVLGDGQLAWAMPCIMGAGPGVGFFALPPQGAKIWVEFERGDPGYPIWSGGFWVAGDTPVSFGPEQAMTKCWAGDNFKLEVLDAPGLASLTLSLATPAGDAVISAGAEELKLDFAGSSIKIAADGVSINGTNLKVLP